MMNFACSSLANTRKTRPSGDDQGVYDNAKEKQLQAEQKQLQETMVLLQVPPPLPPIFAFSEMVPQHG